MRAVVFSVVTIVLYCVVDNVNAIQRKTSNSKRVCEGQTMNIECPRGTGITIVDALYGRMVPGSQACPHSSIRTTYCESPYSVGRVKSLCQGRYKCNIDATNRNFRGDPCEHTYKYLEVEYKCEDPKKKPRPPLNFHLNVGK